MPLDLCEPEDLLYLLKKQYRDTDTTMSACPGCGSPSRGGGHCATCISGEMVKGGASSTSVQDLRSLLIQRVDLNRQIVEATNLVASQLFYAASNKKVERAV